MGHAATATPEAITLRRKAAAAKAWETMRAKRAAQMGEIRQEMAQTADDLLVTDLDIVRLYLLKGCKKTDPNYAPGTPVTGWSHYVVVGREGKEITLFHPWTITRFTIPVFSFRPEQADPSVTLAKASAQIAERVRVNRAAQVEVPQYVETIRAAIAQKEAN